MKARRSLLASCIALMIFAAPVWATAASPLESRLSELSNAGNGAAAYHLGMLYHVGLAGVQKNPKRAFELFKLSAERGDPLGAYKYGCYFDGQGEPVVKSDPERALRYKLIAAQAGYALAQEDVASHLFARGDTAGALRWLEVAAGQGSIMAMMALGALYSGEMLEGAPKVSVDLAKGWKYRLLGSRQIPEMSKHVEAEARKSLGEARYNQVSAEVASWRDVRSQLTQQADEGITASYKLAGLSVPTN